MSYLGISVGLGSLLAPVIGGTLARPCMEYGDSFIFCGPGGFLNDRYDSALSLAAHLNSTASVRTCSNDTEWQST